ncbi:MAG: hypothetical protein AB7F74_11010 [Parvibaculaceae bacterium]
MEFLGDLPEHTLVSLIATSGGSVDLAGGRPVACGILTFRNRVVSKRHRGYLYARSSDTAVLRASIFLLESYPHPLPHLVVSNVELVAQVLDPSHRHYGWHDDGRRKPFTECGIKANTATEYYTIKRAQDDKRFRYSLSDATEVDLSSQFKAAKKFAQEIRQLAARTPLIEDQELWDEELGPST